METLMLVLDMAMISLFVLLSLFIGIFGAGLMFYIRKVRYFIDNIFTHSYAFIHYYKYLIQT